jgi:Spy/CpxP family protein refolding chaperone
MRRTNGYAIAFFIAVFAAGAAAGVVTDRRLQRERMEQQWNDPRAMRTRLADDLSMDATQRAQLDTILDERNRQSEVLMSPVRPQLDSLGAQTRQRIRQLLTSEQQATYDQMLREREDARRQEKRQ